jgi:hypothetical protein
MCVAFVRASSGLRNDQRCYRCGGCATRGNKSVDHGFVLPEWPNWVPGSHAATVTSMRVFKT